jgi:hypothetical protein
VSPPFRAAQKLFKRENKMKFKTVMIAGFSVLALSGCVSQQQADAKMGDGCKAALAAVIEPKTITTVKAVNYSDEQTEGSLYRRITIDLVEKDGFADLDKKYSCLFSQDWGMFKSSHVALLEQVDAGDTFIGKKDGKLIGSMNDYMNLTSKADTAMGQ